jgi:hypothetical protein
MALSDWSSLSGISLPWTAEIIEGTAMRDYSEHWVIVPSPDKLNTRGRKSFGRMTVSTQWLTPWRPSASKCGTKVGRQDRLSKM